MARKQQYGRLLLVAVLLGLAFAGLGYRPVNLQVVRHEELLAKAQQNTRRVSRIEARRGDILDAKGNLLAASIFVKTVCADPVLIGNRQAEVARVLSPLLKMNERELYQRLLPRLRQNEKGETVTNRYVVLKRKVSVDVWDRIQSGMLNVGAAGDEKNLPKATQAFLRNLRQYAVFADAVDDQLRVYPNGPLAAHVLGYVGMRDRDVDGEHMLETVGMDGIERTLNSKLTGACGWRVTEADRLRRELVSLRDQDVEPRDGLNVVLTIDSVIQHALESALAEAAAKHSPVSISGIVVRPRTGEILAMATLPEFDPNAPGNAPDEARRNRVIADIAEPGSTFKVVVVSGALNEGVVRPEDVFNCEHGRFAYGGRVLHDHESYGPLSVESIIAKSSNIGAAKVGLRLGETRLYDYVRAYGFGQATGISLPGEVSGIVHPVKNWSKVSIVQIPMGHGIAVTRLQMTMALCALANDGWLMRPMLVSRLQDRDGHVVATFGPERVRRVVRESSAREMVEALKKAVSPEGTAPKAALEHYLVAGKTGTAQKAGLGGYLPDKYVSSFIGFLPADNPELCISIVMDEPRNGYYGGQTAAPVFKQVAEHAANYLNIHPDINETLETGNQTIAAASSPRL
jgi:cell division protein FtsI/penicillin-binding protein 2